MGSGRAAVLGAAAWLVVGCGAKSPSHDAGPEDGAVPDGYVEPDGDRDGGRDRDEGADGGRDSDGGRDGGADAGPPSCDCPLPTVECVVSVCTDGLCGEEPAADGLACGEMSMGVCVAGACVMRGCGDGYRELGPVPPREACEDGNRLDGDGCSSSCTPSVFLVEEDETGDADILPTAGAPAIGVDGAGRLLFVWTRDTHAVGAQIEARRYTAAGVPQPLSGADPLPIADVVVGSTATPTVAGLVGGGWVVVWAGEAMGTVDVQYRLVSAGGTLGPVRIANEQRAGTQHQAQVAAVGGGFVIAWTDAARIAPSDDGRVNARLFGATGAPLGSEMTVPTVLRETQHHPSVAASGTRWIVLFRDSDRYGPDRWLLRRYVDGAPLDASPLEALVGEARSAQVAALESGDFVVVWQDTLDDVYGRLVEWDSPALRPEAVVTLAASAELERWPVVAPLEGTDYLVAYETGFPPHVDIATSPGATLPMEAAALRSRLLWAQGWVSLTPAPDGVWLAWADSETSRGLWGFSAFLLPLR